MAVKQEEEHFRLNRFCCGWPDLGRQLGGGSSEQLSALSANLFHHLIVLQQQQVVTDRFLASEQSILKHFQTSKFVGLLKDGSKQASKQAI